MEEACHQIPVKNTNYTSLFEINTVGSSVCANILSAPDNSSASYHDNFELNVSLAIFLSSIYSWLSHFLNAI